MADVTPDTRNRDGAAPQGDWRTGPEAGYAHVKDGRDADGFQGEPALPPDREGAGSDDHAYRQRHRRHRLFPPKYVNL